MLRRVTDSVTGLLLQPSWLSSWLPRPQDEGIEESEVEEMQRPSSNMVSKRIETVSSEGEQAQQRTPFIFQKPPGISQDQTNSNKPSSEMKIILSMFPQFKIYSRVINVVLNNITS